MQNPDEMLRLVIDILRRGAFTSLVIVEIGWLSVLWILWLATGAYAADIIQLVFGSFSCGEFNGVFFAGDWRAQYLNLLQTSPQSFAANGKPSRRAPS